MAKASGMSTRIFALLLTTSLSLVAKPWNILVILSDDHRYDFLGFHENAPEFLETPHLDRLANEGAHFANAFVTTSCVLPVGPPY